MSILKHFDIWVASHPFISPISLLSLASKNLRIAASKGDYEELLHAIDTGADVNDADDKGRTALHFVTASGRDAFVQLLIAHGADANKQDANG